MSAYYIEDGSYFRVQNIRLVYNILNKELLGANMPDTQVIFTATRPITIFDYNGFNPEIPNGVDRQTDPIPANYTIGLNLTF
jgi:hypothetical protein